MDRLSLLATLALGVLLVGCAGAGNTATPASEDKPLVSAETREYSFDHIEGIENNLAGEGLKLAEMMGGLNALQKAVNERLAKTPCPVRGKVTIVYVIDEKGVVLDTATAAGIHEVCDQIAEDAVRDMVFSPARKNGAPVKIRMGSPVVFN